MLKCLFLNDKIQPVKR